MIYKCTPCNYSTDDKSNFSKHICTEKHKKKVLESAKLAVPLAYQANKANLELTTRPIGSHPILISDINSDYNGSQSTQVESTSTIDNKSQVLFECDECHDNFKHNSSLSRHKKFNCNKSKVLHKQENDKNILIKLKQTEAEVALLKEKLIKSEILLLHEKLAEEKNQRIKAEQNAEFFKDMAVGAGIIAKTSVNALSFVATNYPNAPEFGPLNYALLIDDSSGKFPELAVYNYNHGTIVKYLSDRFIKFYKKLSSLYYFY